MEKNKKQKQKQKINNETIRTVMLNLMLMIMLKPIIMSMICYQTLGQVLLHREELWHKMLVRKHISNIEK